MPCSYAMVTKPKDSGRLNAKRKQEWEVWLQDTSAYLLVRSSDASTLVEAMTFIAVPDSEQQVILENVQKHKCEVIVVSKEDRTSKFEQWRTAAATCTVPASSSSRDDATVPDAQELSKEQNAEAPQKQRASQDARSPGASSVAAGNELAIPRKRKFSSSPKVTSAIPGDMQRADSDGEASDGSSIAISSSTNAASEMSEEEEAEDALIVVVDPQKQWTTMEDRAGSSRVLLAAQLRDHPL